MLNIVPAPYNSLAGPSQERSEELSGAETVHVASIEKRETAAHSKFPTVIVLRTSSSYEDAIELTDLLSVIGMKASSLVLALQFAN